MDIVKMSPLTALLAEEEKKKGTRKKKLTLLPSIARLCAFVFFFFSYNACMETTREQKHHHRERRAMMHSANERAPRFFLLCAQAYVNTHFFLIFFFAHCLHGAAENKGTRDLSLSLILTYIYATKVMTRFFFLTRAISLTAKFYNK
jgi:hypothetical protein